MSSPPASPSNRGTTSNSASNRQSSTAGSGQPPPALQRSSTVVGLQSKPSFISTLRTLPTQRQSIVGAGDAAGAPPSSRGDPLSTNGPQSSLTFDDPPLSMRGPTSTGPQSMRQQNYNTMNNMMSPNSAKAGSFPMSDESLMPQSSSRVFGTATDGDDVAALEGTVGASPRHPRTSTSASSRTPPLVEEAAVPRPAPTLLRTTTWKLFFMDVVKLPEGTAEAYDQVFEENDMPPPTQIEILQHGVDHEVLTALGIRSVGQRTRIIAACRNQAQSMLRVGSDGSRPYGRGHGLPHHVHFDQSPRQYSSGGALGGARHQTPMFPKIYRANFEEGEDETTQQRFLREDQSSASGIGDIGEHVTSVGGSFGSEAHVAQVDQVVAIGTKGSSSLHEPLIRRESHLPGGSGDVGKRGSVNVDGDDNATGTSTPSPTYPSAFVVDENRVHEFMNQSNGRHGYTWIDLVGRDPKRLAFRDHLKHIVKTYHFAEQLLLDIDLTLALPQMISCPNEPDQFLIILRVAAESSGGIEEDSLHLLTNRIMIAVHMGTNTIVSIHRRDSMQMTALRECWYATFQDKPMSALLCRILDDGLLSYVDAIHDSESLLDEYEALMLKHSVGGSKASASAGGSSTTSFAMRQSFAANASFSSEESAPWWSAKNICEKMFGSDTRDGASTRNRSSTVIHSQQQAATRLRNKEYQEEMMGSSTFSRQRMNQLLYHLHRRCSVYNRMLTLTQTTLEVSYATLHLASADYAEQVGRSCGELAMKAETLHDNCQNLLNLHLSLVSFRTNELMNLLTVYSAIFIPITFVCSVYGMNFTNMPELQLYYGYYYCWGGMLLIVCGIITWFRRKGFL